MQQASCRSRVLLALPFLHYGVGRLAMDIAAAARASGRMVDFLTCGGQGDMGDDPALLAEAAALESEVHHADIFSRDPAVMQAAAARVADVCRARQVSVVHAFTAPAAAAGLGHPPVMASVVGWAPDKARWQREMDAHLLQQCDLVTAVSDAVAAEVREAGCTRGDIRLILNGVALTPSRDLERAAASTPLTVIGVMAHLVPRKGVDVLLEAVARLDPRRWSALLVAGQGESEADLRALARGLLPEDRVCWLGTMSTGEFFERADIVVVPSRSDALPLVLLQAMAYGRPVVASAVGGIPEAATHRAEVLLVPPDDPAALATALADTLADPAAALARARAARARIARDFSLDAATRSYLACYAELGG